jgi:anti-sigma factor RsiW
MRRPLDRHISEQELMALAPSPSDSGLRTGLAADAISNAQQHLQECADCRQKLSKYRQLVERSPAMPVIAGAVPPGPDCPRDEDVDWHEVCAGLWPELKAKQLIAHAALCDHCGPLLRAAVSTDEKASPEEEELLAQLKAPSRPVLKAMAKPAPRNTRVPSFWTQILKWKMAVPALALMIVFAMLGTRWHSSPKRLSGPSFAEFAVSTHRQHAEGRLALEVRSDSQHTINQWFLTKSPLSVALPDSPASPGEERPFRVEGARLMQIAGKPAAFIAYEVLTPKLKTLPASLIVAPDSTAIASGGVQANFKKVSFHYATIQGYKVVTWSLHGLTYALVSQESNSTQRSCMVCHSAMRDRDLSEVPTPLTVDKTQTIWQ